MDEKIRSGAAYGLKCGILRKVRAGGRADQRHWLSYLRYPARRDGVIALALFLLPLLSAMALGLRRHSLDAGTLTILISVALGMPVLWLTWATYRDARRSESGAGDMSLAGVADRLAVAVGAQWEAEAAVRRLNDPYPLPVSWAETDPALADCWDSLVKLARTGAGWPAPPPPGTWATAPAHLAGTDNDLVGVLSRVPTGRLVVLGEPGSGKTLLMVRLLLDLLALRACGGPVPVMVSAATWNPSGQDLRSWLAAELVFAYPALAAPPPRGTGRPTLASALLVLGQIVPIIDGLDEIPEMSRRTAISRINDGLRPGQQLILTCRAQEYRDAVRPADGIEVTLRGAATVQMRPLDPDAVARYLQADAGGPRMASRWKPVLATLGTEAPVGQALRTPLMVGLARAIYNPRPGKQAEPGSDPASLCNPRLADRLAVERHLLDAFIPATYRSEAHGQRWTAAQAERWLLFLARHLQNSAGGSDLAWWQLRRAESWTRALGPRAPARGMRIGVRRLAASFSADPFEHPGALPVASALLGGIAGDLRLTPGGTFHGYAIGFFYGCLAMGMIRAVVGLVHGLREAVNAVPADLTEAIRPRQVLTRDRNAAIVLFLLTGLMAAIVAGLLVASAAAFLYGFPGAILIAAPIGAGIAAGTLLSLSSAAWPSYELARISLALRRKLPWPLIGFLEDAHQRGVLRQVGGSYQFRHVELQRRLAARSSGQGRGR